jgi:hypothetical protein
VKKLIQELNRNDIFWQYPVITEQTFFKQNKNNPNYLPIPWANIIDNYNKYDKTIFEKLKTIVIKYINQDENYFTACQHIRFREIINIAKEFCIKKIYTPHKIIGEDFIDGIEIRPIPLFAVNYEDPKRNSVFRNIDFVNHERKLLFSFIGNYNDSYISKIRSKLLELKAPNSIIKIKDEWHFHNLVYQEEQTQKGYQKSKINFKDLNEYNLNLLNSKFSLCPSGSGPNSIRLWESLAVGSIPVLISDQLDLPYHPLWDRAIIKIAEEDYIKIPELLSSISSNEVQERRKNCLKIYHSLKNNFANRRIAICFHGLLRNTSITTKSIKKNIIEKLKLNHFHVDCYLHTSNLLNGTQDLLTSFQAAISCKASVEDESLIDKQIPHEEIIKYGNHYTDYDEDISRKKPETIFNAIKTIYSQRKSFELAKGSGIYYDSYLMVRPDLYFQEAISLRAFYNSKIVNVFKTPHGFIRERMRTPGYENLLYIQDFVLSGEETHIDLITNRINDIEDYNKNFKVAVHPETLLGYCIERNNIEIKYFDFNFYRIKNGLPSIRRRRKVPIYKLIYIYACQFYREVLLKIS